MFCRDLGSLALEVLFSLQLLCACLARRNELSDAFVLPSAMPGVALATWEEQGIGQECCCRWVWWHREGWLGTFGSGLSQMCKEDKL